MRDEMADTQDQTAVAVADQPTTESEQPQAVDATQAEAVPATTDAVPFDWSQINDDWIRQAQENAPALQGLLERERLNGENTGRQRERSELRRQQGDKDVLNRWERDLLTKRGMNPDDLTDEERGQARYLSQIASDVQRVEVAKTFVEGVIGDFTADEQTRIREALGRLEDSPDGIEELRDALIDTAAQRRVQSAQRSLKTKDVSPEFWEDDEFTPEAIPANSKAGKAMRAWLEAEFQKEAAARGIEANTGRQNPPATTTGAPVGNPIERLSSLSKSDRVAELIANPELREQAWNAVGASGR